VTLARFLVVVFALVIIAVAIGVGYMLLSESSPLSSPVVGTITDPTGPVDPSDSTKQVFTVEPGSSAADIGNQLQQRGLIRSALVFRFAADQAGVGGSLAAGDYELSRSMSMNEIIEVLARGQVKRGLLATIPEGWRAEQVADRLDATGITTRDEFLRAVAAPSSVPDLELLGEPRPTTLEGYLFPETYEVQQKVPGTQAADLMIRTFSQRVGQQLRSNSEVDLSPHQLLTLASIVEREAQQPQERPLIASVYLNRLARQLPLQADPTVQYAVATRDGSAATAYNYWKRDLTDADLQLDSPYNTYVHTGLPPAPICNPGEASIRAVLQPARTDYLYFVARQDGSGGHLFARTLDEHNANVAQVQRHSPYTFP
jgi:UPF0755 protein